MIATTQNSAYRPLAPSEHFFEHARASATGGAVPRRQLGRGSTGEMWKLEDHLWDLLSECRQLLSDRPLFFLINAYTARLSPSVTSPAI